SRGSLRAERTGEKLARASLEHRRGAGGQHARSSVALKRTGARALRALPTGKARYGARYRQRGAASAITRERIQRPTAISRRPAESRAARNIPSVLKSMTISPRAPQAMTPPLPPIAGMRE